VRLGRWPVLLVLLPLLTGCSDYRERRRLASVVSDLGAAAARRDSAGAARLLHDPETVGTLLRGADPHLVRDLGATLRIREADFFDGRAIIFGDFRHCSARESVSISFGRTGQDWRIGRIQMRTGTWAA